MKRTSTLICLVLLLAGCSGISERSSQNRSACELLSILVKEQTKGNDSHYAYVKRAWNNSLYLKYIEKSMKILWESEDQRDVDFGNEIYYELEMIPDTFYDVLPEVSEVIVVKNKYCVD
jgi:hypothetical protein